MESVVTEKSPGGQIRVGTVLVVVGMVVLILIAVGYILGYSYKKSNPPSEREVPPVVVSLERQLMAQNNLKELNK